MSKMITRNFTDVLKSETSSRTPDLQGRLIIYLVKEYLLGLSLFVTEASAHIEPHTREAIHRFSKRIFAMVISLCY